MTVEVDVYDTSAPHEFNLALPPIASGLLNLAVTSMPVEPTGNGEPGAERSETDSQRLPEGRSEAESIGN